MIQISNVILIIFFLLYSLIFPIPINSKVVRGVFIEPSMILIHFYLSGVFPGCYLKYTINNHLPERALSHKPVVILHGPHNLSPTPTPSPSKNIDILLKVILYVKQLIEIDDFFHTIIYFLIIFRNDFP